MTHEQIMERALNDLQVKTSAHAGVWKLGEEERWDWDGEKGTLLFTFKDKIVHSCSIGGFLCLLAQILALGMGQ